ARFLSGPPYCRIGQNIEGNCSKMAICFADYNQELYEILLISNEQGNSHAASLTPSSFLSFFR
ncbi:hypothetical protein, partial [Klebsiella pneumoniae]|uniref:hypothetical protein n=1 Tax=Klebsiella pneumoniae TaxID=573 RepID=UPI0040554AB6